MKTQQLNLFLLGIAASAIIASCQNPNSNDQKAHENAGMTEADQVKRGEYLVKVMGCNDCHSPKIFGPNGMEPDPDRLLSGHPSELPLGKIDTTLMHDWIYFNQHLTAYVGPWGVSYSANITSDETGIGNWTLDQFKKVLREGKYMGLDGGRPILPPMPWQGFASLTDDDIASIFAYLKTTKPVRNVVPGPRPASELEMK